MNRKIVIKTVILLFAGLFYSCKELPPAEEFDPSNTRLHVVWSKPFYADSSYAVILEPVITDRYVAFIGDPLFSTTKRGNRIVVFDKANGDWHTAWIGGVDIDDGVSHYVTDLLIGGSNKDILFYFSQKSLHAFSLSTGQSLWKIILDNDEYYKLFRGHPTLFGSDILAVYANLQTATFYVNKYNSLTGQESNLFSFKEYVNTMQWAINERGDTLFFFIDSWKSAYCYNLTIDSVVWKYTRSEQGENTSFLPIIVENKYVLFQNKYVVVCLDFSTGKLIWEKQIVSIENLPISYHDGKVIVRPHYGNITCYDVRSENLLWTSSDVGLSLNSRREYGKMDIYKGNLYFTTGGTHISYLYCISLATGKVNWYDVGPNKGILGGLAIDQQTGYLYCHSEWSVMCIDLNKTPKK